jgi:hypothetical protein
MIIDSMLAGASHILSIAELKNTYSLFENHVISNPSLDAYGIAL